MSTATEELITNVTLTSVTGKAGDTTAVPGTYPNEIDPSNATASMPATRAVALLMPDATPA